MRIKVGGGGRDKEDCGVATMKFICPPEMTADNRDVVFWFLKVTLCLKQIKTASH